MTEVTQADTPDDVVEVASATDKTLECRARKICEHYGVNPDEVIDDYGPVRMIDHALYHLNEARDEVVEAMEETLRQLKEAGRG